MNCALFVKMDKVFSLKNKTLKKILKNGKKILEKSGNFVSPEKWEPCLSTMNKLRIMWSLVKKLTKMTSLPGVEFVMFFVCGAPK